MRTNVSKIRSKLGKAPGELIYTGESKPTKAIINVISYNQSLYTESEDVDIESLKNLEQDRIHWINFLHISDSQKLQEIGTIFSIHRLTLEDIINVNQRTKTEFYEDYIYIVIKILAGLKKEEKDLRQLSIVVKDNILITFFEEENYIVSLLRNNLKSNIGNIRNKDIGYLVFSLLDIIVDSYFSKINDFSIDIEEVDERIPEDVTEDLFVKLKQLKKDILNFRRYIIPMKDIIFQFQRKEKGFINETNQIYFLDLYDHTIRINESLDSMRESLSNMTDIYLSIVNNRLNEIMRILTIISTIFIPLSFIAGIYGMNFTYMPELTFKYGYFIVLGVMATIAIIMIILFKRNKWF